MNLAPIVTISRSVVAARALRYPEAEKPDADEPRVMYRDGINCLPGTAVEEFAQVRAKHGYTDEKMMRKVPASYELPEQGEEPTHLKKHYPGGGTYWAEPKEDEVATHVHREGIAYEPAGRAVATHRRQGRRWVADSVNGTHRVVEGGYVRGTEAITLIYSFDLSSVNPRDPEATANAFRYVYDELAATFPSPDGGCAVQAKLVAQADAKGMVDENGNQLTEGGKFHVHAVLNAVQMKDCILPDGEIITGGKKLGTQLTDIEWLRDRNDAFAAEHPEYGFVPQTKNRQARKADRRSAMDRRMEAQGQRSNHDLIRDARWRITETLTQQDLTALAASMQQGGPLDLSEVTAAMKAAGVTMTEPGWRRGKAPKVPKLSYAFDGMTTPVRGEKLGDLYTYESVVEDMTAIVEGRVPKRRPQPQPKLPPKPEPQISDDEFADGVDTLVRLVTEERRDRVQDWAEERAAERGQSVEDIMARLPKDEAAQYRAVQVWGAIKAASDEREAELDAWIEDWARSEGVDGVKLAAIYGYDLDNAADRETLRRQMVTEQEAVMAAQQIEVESEIAGVEVPETPTAVTPVPVEPTWETPAVTPPPAPRAETVEEMMARVRGDMPELRSSAEDKLAEIEARIAEIPTSPAKVEAEREEVTAEVVTAEIEQVSATEERQQAEEQAPEAETEAVLREDAPEPADLRDVEAAEARARQLAEQRKTERMRRLQELNRRVEQLDQQAEEDYQPGW